jgi:hypothetical protein
MHLRVVGKTGRRRRQLGVWAVFAAAVDFGSSILPLEITPFVFAPETRTPFVFVPDTQDIGLTVMRPIFYLIRTTSYLHVG